METELTKLVKSIAHKCKSKFYARHIQDEDLYQEGFLALAKAKKYFNEVHNVKFTTYAYRAIQSNISRYIQQNSSRLNIDREAILEEVPDEIINHHLDLKEAINTLSKEEKQLIIDYYFSNLTYSAIGTKIGKSHNAAFIKIQNIVEKLRRIMNRHESN